MFKQSYSYQDIGLIPRTESTINSREDVNTSINFLGSYSSLPLVLAPMSSVVDIEMVNAVSREKGICFLPRTNNNTKDFNKYLQLISEQAIDIDRIIPSISTKDALKKAKLFKKAGAKIICIDVANGFHSIVKKVVLEIIKELPGMFIVTGNVGSVEGYEFLADIGVDAVRCGIGGGGSCVTSVATSVGTGQFTLIRNISNYKSKYKDDSGYYLRQDERYSRTKWPLIIADGGISQVGEIVKAITAGADLVMMGKFFAGCSESPGPVVKYNNYLYKQYAGQASFAVKQSDRYIEGEDSLVKYTGTLEAAWHRISDGLRSGMAYLNCRNIKELKYLDDNDFYLLSSGAVKERGTHF